jgi:hypothetical protein
MNLVAEDTAKAFSRVYVKFQRVEEAIREAESKMTTT